MKATEIKEDIINYLKIHNCALASQIIKSFDISDSRYISANLKELMDEKKILKILYRGFDFIILPGYEDSIKRKVRIIKGYIYDIVKKFGPIRGKPLVKKIRTNFDFNVSHFMVYRLAKELIEYGKIASVKIALSNIYYIKSDKRQVNDSKNIIKEYDDNKKLSKMYRLCEDFYNELCNEYNLNIDEQQKLKDIQGKIKPFLTINCTGRSYKDLIHILYLILIKREIFYFLHVENKFELLKPWLNLYEVILKRNLDLFQGFHFKTYQFFTKQILNNQEFCNNDDKIKIFNTPNYLLRMKFLITYFNFNECIFENIFSFIKNTISNGFGVDGKDIKGILGGFICIFSKYKNLRFTQSFIAKKLNITEVTLRARKKDILKYIHGNRITIPIIENIKDDPARNNISENLASLNETIENGIKEHQKKEQFTYSEKILKAISDDWYTFEQICTKLKLEDQFDKRFLKIRLDGLIRKKEILTNIQNNVKLYKSINNL